MSKEKFYEELLSRARKCELASCILDTVYSKPEEPGDQSMVGLYANKVFVQVNDTNTIILDECGNPICTIDTEFYLVNDYNDEYYLMHKNELYQLCDKLQYLLDASSVVFI